MGGSNLSLGAGGLWGLYGEEVGGIASFGMKGNLVLMAFIGMAGLGEEVVDDLRISSIDSFDVMTSTLLAPSFRKCSFLSWRTPPLLLGLSIKCCHMVLLTPAVVGALSSVGLMP